MSVFRTGLALMLLAGLCLPLEAQQFSGTLRGVVQDSTGAIVPGAEVSVVEVATNDTHVIVTGDSGTYVVPQLKPGNFGSRSRKTDSRAPRLTRSRSTWGGSESFDVTLEIGQTSRPSTSSASGRRWKPATPRLARPSKIDAWSTCR